MSNTDSIRHVRGESLFIDDVTLPEGVLYGYVYYSPIAHGKIQKLDFSSALKSEGVKGVFSAKDIPGENQIGGIVPDENLFAEDTVHFIGHPIALVVADSLIHAHDAVKKIKSEFKKYPVIETI
ncbi:MAG: xanthine dehydrogenase, partial [Bacteroidetes bacterium]|nr:xanthine dehydrogenase [Bacteroidota bacterium]